jgi:CTP:molybdopterin cytidylyltransferase MocA
VTLAALIAAYHDSADEGEGLRATLPLAGRTLLERQARLAASAGARPIVVVADRQPRELLAAVERLRAEGLDVVLALSPAEAAKAVQTGDRILLIGDGILAHDGDVARLIAAEGPALLTVPDVRYDDRFERIDAESRWAGLGIVTASF